MYYAFYAPDNSPAWSGELELRGLKPGRYQVVDYERGTQLGTVDSNSPHIKASFDQHLLLEVSPR
jgi:alpha-galactosidase